MAKDDELSMFDWTDAEMPVVKATRSTFTPETSSRKAFAPLPLK